MATKAAKALLQNIASAGQAYEAGDREAKRKLLHLCQELTVELEQPGETFLRHNWVEVGSLSNATFETSKFNVASSQRERSPSVSQSISTFLRHCPRTGNRQSLVFNSRL